MPSTAVRAFVALGFVLISAEAGKERDVHSQLQRVWEIVEMMPLFGEYDLIVRLEAPDFDILGKLIVERIRSIDGVVDTKTLTGTRF